MPHVVTVARGKAIVIPSMLHTVVKRARDPLAPLVGATLGQRIKSAYILAGFNRSTFRNALGVAYTTIIGWESGENHPTTENLLAIADVTGRTLGEITGETRVVRGHARPEVNAFLEAHEKDMLPEDAEYFRTAHFEGQVDGEYLHEMWRARERLRRRVNAMDFQHKALSEEPPLPAGKARLAPTKRTKR
mgnify:CR=1 FL=1